MKFLKKYKKVNFFKLELLPDDRGNWEKGDATGKSDIDHNLKL